jgi:transporter family-2 protein
MESILFILFVGLIGGIAVVIQASFAGIISNRIGLIENAFFVFGGGLITSLLLILVVDGGKIKDWRTVPWYVYLAGPLGIVIVTSIGYSIPRIGIVATLTLIVATQLIFGAIMDHFGLLTIARPLDLPRLIGIAILLVSTWIVLR